MPSQLHEVLVEMFRARPELARELLETCAGVRLADGVCELASIDLSQAVPSEYRADAVTVVRGADGRPHAAVIVEVQLAIDREKVWTWPVYLTALRARMKCPVLLFVLARDPVAAWARGTIETGHPGFVLAPVVVGLSEVPRITEPTVAARSPELAVLSVFGHRELAVGYAATQALFTVADEARRLYLDLILTALPQHARRLLEAMMIKGYEYQSEYARRYVAEGREEGREEVLDGLRDDALRFVRSRAGTVSEEHERVIRGLRDHRALAEVIAWGAGAGDPGALDALLARLSAGSST